MSYDIQYIKNLVAGQHDKIRQLKTEIAYTIVGQEAMVNGILTGLLTHGHILLEGVPGLAKTTAIKAVADAVAAKFRRIQFTPDLLPADLIGTMIYLPGEGTFKTRKGPIFANFVLADEINRAPSKVQSALLEAMQERQVTIGDETYPLEGLFLVMATQNPIEQEGTYPLPEAQVDRFMLKLKITYPSKEDERQILDRALQSQELSAQEQHRSRSLPSSPVPVITAADIAEMQSVTEQIYIDPSIRDYILSVVRATRFPGAAGLKPLEPMIEFGASPRASIFLGKGARAAAFLAGRGYVTPQDVKDVAFNVLRHRVVLTYEAEAEEMTSEDVIAKILDTVPVP
ncbi:MAG: MoxR family ATPase [Planctomycetaceae bacterium]|jgi:MoxR-like ATPase|nr:MoxR family ATPase [Planctomycetaceae bacterium]